MRRIEKVYDFDIWLPKLAPPEELLKLYVIKKKITWNEFKKRFTKEVLIKNKEYVKILILLSKKKKITLLCWEESPKKCHRRLVAEECKRINSKLNVVLR